MISTLLLATTNPHKVREIRALLDGAGVDIVGLDPASALEPPEETGATFAENARLKARYYAMATGMTAVAEDSGLEVDALGGLPGVESARFAGADTSYPEKFARLYEMLEAGGGRDSPARFVCALAVAEGDRVVFEARGTVEGLIAPEPQGTHGFGYDPIFFYPPEGRTLGEVSDGVKRAVSHRGAAFSQLRAWLTRGAWGNGEWGNGGMRE
jgi:XTP/dITP diphosphohydrolase